MHNQIKQVTGKLVFIDSEKYYHIDSVEKMEPFFMSIVSGSDLWMWVSSTGALTAGRKNPDCAIFPYLSDDRIHRSPGLIGPVTMLESFRDGKKELWMPFTPNRHEPVKRSLYKHVLGNAIIFEEEHLEWGASFLMTWKPADHFGWVRKSAVINHKSAPLKCRVLDGLLDIMPAGITERTEQILSNLADSYKRSETGDWGKSAIYTLESLISDTSNPAESLTATLSCSLKNSFEGPFLDEQVSKQFIAGEKLSHNNLLLGKQGSYLLSGEIEVFPQSQSEWQIVVDTDLDHAELSKRIKKFQKPEIEQLIAEDIKASSQKLADILVLGDGFHKTADAITDAHHLSNVLFNTMRGGIFLHEYQISISDFKHFLKIRNRQIGENHQKKLNDLAEVADYNTVYSAIKKWDNVDLSRLFLEYLPLYFSRRHGDPSRPWNRFSIEVQNQDGGEILAYQGNWRDIFQNWEALLYSFPCYLPNVVAKFVNASTADGYNPYHISQEGIDWEVLDPEDPWSYIGYWGDHQIVYLLRLLEQWKCFDADGISNYLQSAIFTYANVPYVIKDHQSIVQDPRNTITFNTKLHKEIEERIKKEGSDGRLLFNEHGELIRVSLIEKLIVPALAKMTSFVPGGGIWMNTQRPEWNDANNALAGYGLSMVTLFYLRRYLKFMVSLLEPIKQSNKENIQLSEDVSNWLKGGLKVLQEFSNQATQSLLIENATERRSFLDAMGEVGSLYRKKIYSNFSSKLSEVSVSLLLEWANLSIDYLDATIAVNKRSDGLFHSYNLIAFPDETSAEIKHLAEMLEGQVAVVSSGYLNAKEVSSLIDSLYQSRLYARNRNSFLLYPNKNLPSFFEKNCIPKALVEKHLAFFGDEVDLSSVLNKGDDGLYHFRSFLKNEFELEKTVKANGLNSNEKQAVLSLYQEVFNHHNYTGRSSSMYKYEGLGSIYWHMVSKLQLAVLENYFLARDTGESSEVISHLAENYNKIRNGLGYRKTPSEFGAIPIDCYSHTPAGLGAQQPGMTGQVKEEIICRYGELGIRFINQQISLQLGLIPSKELFLENSIINFTICGVDFEIVRQAKSVEEKFTSILYSDGRHENQDGLCLSKKVSAIVFNRSGEIEKVKFMVGYNLD